MNLTLVGGGKEECRDQGWWWWSRRLNCTSFEIKGIEKLRGIQIGSRKSGVAIVVKNSRKINETGKVEEQIPKRNIDVYYDQYLRPIRL